MSQKTQSNRHLWYLKQHKSTLRTNGTHKSATKSELTSTKPKGIERLKETTNVIEKRKDVNRNIFKV